MEKHVVQIDENGKAKYSGTMDEKSISQKQVSKVLIYSFDTQSHAETFEHLSNNPTRSWNS